MIANSVLDTIGATPHIRLSRMFPEANVWVKSERGNPGGSIKDRIALAMVEAAEASGALKPGGLIIEPTSGNTGIGLALVAAVKGYRLVLVMPESMSVERRRLMQAYGATFDLTPKERGMKGAIERAQELVGQHEGAWMPQQFENPPISTCMSAPRRRKSGRIFRKGWMRSSPALAPAGTSPALPRC